MNGKESEDDLARCAIWDAIYRGGPMGKSELSAMTDIPQSRVAAMVKHSWFATTPGGMTHIATRTGEGRGERGMRMAS